ncbi:uncharacterized protein [Diabrotica undecimpunctata]|uniref:uncharacterized protein n=1 Tax=Diabrotica undecimpunctata TaxID=50387 RepID=UPI003B635DB1
MTRLKEGYCKTYLDFRKDTQETVTSDGASSFSSSASFVSTERNDSAGTEDRNPMMSRPSTSSNPQSSQLVAQNRKRRKTESSVESFLIKTSTNQKEALDRQRARYAFTTNSPFKHVDHPQFIRPIEELRPGYKPPSQRDISEHLLDNIYDEEMQKFRDFIQNEVVCLGFDGWSNVHNDPIVCVTVTTKSGEVYLWEILVRQAMLRLQITLIQLHMIALRSVRAN